jgi:hypothetical protein
MKKAIKEWKRCSSPECKSASYLEDWAGWRWCIRHWFFNWRWGGGKKWFELRHLKIFFPRKYEVRAELASQTLIQKNKEI